VGLGNAASATILAALVAGLGRPLRRRPALRHCLWALVLLKLVTPPVWVVPVAWLPASTRAAVADALTVRFEDPVPGGWHGRLDESGERLVFLDRDVSAPPVRDVDLDPLMAVTLAPDVGRPPAIRIGVPWVPIASAVWLGGSAVVLVLGAVRIRRFQRLLGAAVPASEEVHAQVGELAERLGLTTPPGVWWMTGAVSPMVWAVGTRPRLILPEELWKRLGEAQRETLLVHELAHLKRGDHRVRCLELLATGLYWWFPLVWRARRALREAEEQCCDAWVVWTFPGRVRAYADALVEAVDFLSRAAPLAATSAGGLGHVRHLKRRLIMIMQGSTPRALHWSGGLLALSLAAGLLPIAPTWAQAPAPKPDGGPDSADTTVHRLDDTVARLKLDDVLPDSATHDVKALDLALDGDDVEEIVLDAGQDSDRRAEAVNKVVERLKEQLKKSSAHEGEGGRDQRRAIEQAIRDLQRALADQRRVVVRRRDLRLSDAPAKPSDGEKGPKDGDQDEASAKRKAEVEKARAEIAELSAKLQAKHKEVTEVARQLRDAQKRLAEVLGRPSAATSLRRSFRIETRDGRSVVVPEGRAGVGVVPGRVAPERGLTVVPGQDYLFYRGPARPDQERRLSELEKKLGQLQEELSKLKKARE
jgi:beta-lactamase regulating signal transducer with metallopeptidase domain